MTEQALAHKLAAILYADVEGYSRLTGADEAGTHRTLSAYLDLFAETIKAHRGEVKHYAGDAVLADFTTVSDALNCAVAVQQAIKEKNETVSEATRVQFRIGLNLGEVIVDRGEVYGNGVNVAARLETLAEPGGICVSGNVVDAVGASEAGIAFDVGVQNRGQFVRKGLLSHGAVLAGEGFIEIILPVVWQQVAQRLLAALQDDRGIQIRCVDLKQQLPAAPAGWKDRALGGSGDNLADIRFAVFDHFGHCTMLCAKSNTAIDRHVDAGMEVAVRRNQRRADISHELPILARACNLPGFLGHFDGVL